jgi:hypothetical protein
VHYETGEAADAAVKAVNGMLLNDKKVFVGPHINRKERMSKFEEMKAQFTNIYVKNGIGGLSGLVVHETVTSRSTVLIGGNLAAEDVTESGKGVVQGLVVNVLVQVLELWTR